MNSKQVLSMIVVILGVMVASTSQLNDLFGPQVTKHVVSASALLMSILSGVSGILSGQASLVQDVQSMPGVEKITVNAQANTTLASMAVDPTNQKVEASPGASAAVSATARNA